MITSKKTSALERTKNIPEEVVNRTLGSPEGFFVLTTLVMAADDEMIVYASRLGEMERSLLGLEYNDVIKINLDKILSDCLEKAQ